MTDFHAVGGGDTSGLLTRREFPLEIKASFKASPSAASTADEITGPDIISLADAVGNYCEVRDYPDAGYPIVRFTISEITKDLAVYLQKCSETRKVALAVDPAELAAQLRIDRDHLLAAMTIGAFTVEEPEPKVQTGGNVEGDEEVDNLISMLQNATMNMEEITLAIHKFVVSRDGESSGMIKTHAQNVLPLIRLVVVTVATAVAGDSPRTDLLVNALAGGGLVKPLTEASAVTYNQLADLLNDECQPMLTELMLQNIINKRTPAHYLYNACYLHSVNNNDAFSEHAGMIGRLPDEADDDRDSIRLTQETMDIIQGYRYEADKYQPGLYDVFPPIPDLMLHEVVQGSLLAHSYMRLTEDAFEAARKTIETRGFAWTLSAFTRILPPPDSRHVSYAAAVEIQSRNISFKRKAHSKDSDAALYNLYYMDMHGALTIDIDDNSVPTDKLKNVIVPDNLVMVRTGLVGRVSFANVQDKTEDVIAKVCSEDIHDLAMTTEVYDLGCDIVPPGYSVNDMKLSKDDVFWTGVVDCTEQEAIEVEDTVYLSTVMARASAIASQRGRMALFVLLACHETNHTARQQQGLQANVQAALRLPRIIRFTNRPDGKPRDFRVQRTIRESSEIRLSNPSIPKGSGELKWLVNRINTAEKARREARNNKRKAEWEAAHSDMSGGLPPTAAMNYGLSAALLFVTFAASVLGAAS